ncbi:hypothetical protein OEZ85_010978 [Tetradesmus obliquus]|uniref:Uncharacterized protein n=1 Tax=Tetradesmus obliquus TaxID=3088 RepID=A0ABY8TNV4_TETOB|nr:hypothetical protein OEZ85_010978 [Tetradesmus obliquus]
MSSSFKYAWLSTSGLHDVVTAAEGDMVVLDTATYRSVKSRAMRAERDAVLLSLSGRVVHGASTFTEEVQAECVRRLERVIQAEAAGIKVSITHQSSKQMDEQLQLSLNHAMKSAAAYVLGLDDAACMPACRKELLRGLQELHVNQVYTDILCSFMCSMVGQVCEKLCQDGRTLRTQLQPKDACVLRELHQAAGCALIKELFRLPRVAVVQLPAHWASRLQVDEVQRAECAAAHASMLQASSRSHELELCKRFCTDHAMAWCLGMESLLLSKPAACVLLDACGSVVHGFASCDPDNKWAATSLASQSQQQQQQQSRGTEATTKNKSKATA